MCGYSDLKQVIGNDIVGSKHTTFNVVHFADAIQKLQGKSDFLIIVLHRQQSETYIHLLPPARKGGANVNTATNKHTDIGCSIDVRTPI